jgi:hypothetical protein
MPPGGCLPEENRPKRWHSVVRPARFERATFWFVAVNYRSINGLALSIVIVSRCDRFLF